MLKSSSWAVDYKPENCLGCFTRLWKSQEQEGEKGETSRKRETGKEKKVTNLGYKLSNETLDLLSRWAEQVHTLSFKKIWDNRWLRG